MAPAGLHHSVVGPTQPLHQFSTQSCFHCQILTWSHTARVLPSFFFPHLVTKQSVLVRTKAFTRILVDTREQRTLITEVCASLHKCIVWSPCIITLSSLLPTILKKPNMCTCMLSVVQQLWYFINLSCVIATIRANEILVCAEQITLWQCTRPFPTDGMQERGVWLRDTSLDLVYTDVTYPDVVQQFSLQPLKHLWKLLILKSINNHVQPLQPVRSHSLFSHNRQILGNLWDLILTTSH